MQEKSQKNKINNIKSKEVKDTLDFSYKLASKLKAGDIICLSGDLGTGKTVIAKGIAKYFKLENDVISPTFNILKIYDLGDNKIKKIYHYDLYRLKSTKELYDIGFDEYVYYKDGIHIIEWPDVAKDLLPEHYYNIVIDYDNPDSNKRIIKYEKR